MKAWILNYIDNNLNKEFNWFSVIFYFSVSGVYIFYLSKKMAFLDYEMELIPRIIGLLVLGLKNGIIINLSMSLLISLTGKFFKAKFRFKETMKAMYIAFKPYLVAFLLIILDIIIVHFGELNPNFEELILVQIVKILIDLSIGAVGVLSIIILFSCLKRTQELTLGKTILNYLVAGILNAPIYIWALGIW